MRAVHLVSGGWFSAVIVAACCQIDPPAPPPPTAGDAMQACLDWCEAAKPLCGSPPGTCTNHCDGALVPAGKACQDDFYFWYTCAMAYMETHSMDANLCEIDGMYKGCAKEYDAAYDCFIDVGCPLSWMGCNFDNPPGCHCYAECGVGVLHSICSPNGTSSVCECSIDAVMVGTCEGGPELFCEKEVWKGCCGQYFEWL